VGDLSTDLVEVIDKMKASGWGSRDILSFVKTVLQNREEDDSKQRDMSRQEIFDDWK
jgi:hypothetical protein